MPSITFVSENLGECALASSKAQALAITVNCNLHATLYISRMQQSEVQQIEPSMKNAVSEISGPHLHRNVSS